MSWEGVLRKSPPATATRSAELWAQNDYDVYQKAVEIIQLLASDYATVEEIKERLIRWLPERMASLEGFMDELIEMEPMDSISDVDWEEVVEMFSDEIEEAVAKYSFDMRYGRWGNQ